MTPPSGMMFSSQAVPTSFLLLFILPLSLIFSLMCFFSNIYFALVTGALCFTWPVPDRVCGGGEGRGDLVLPSGTRQPLNRHIYFILFYICKFFRRKPLLFRKAEEKAKERMFNEWFIKWVQIINYLPEKTPAVCDLHFFYMFKIRGGR